MIDQTRHTPLPESTVSMAYLTGLVDYLERQGVDRAEFLSAFALTPAALEDPHGRLATAVFEAMLEQGAAVAADPDIGLHVGECIKPGQYGVLGFSVMSCATLEDAIHRHMRYENLVSTRGHTRYMIEEDPVRLLWETNPPASRHLAEENVASWVTFTRWMTGQPVTPLRIAFQHNAPADTRAHQRLFQCEVLFGQPRVEIHFPRKYLAIKLHHHDPAMLSMMDAYAERLLISLSANPDVVEQARALIAQHLQDGEVSLGRVASDLHLSERQLQRKLQDAGLGYQALLDQTRETLALRYMADPHMDFTDMTFLLGFSDQSAFQRAFKRWTGLTPGKYRDQVRQSST